MYNIEQEIKQLRGPSVFDTIEENKWRWDDLEYMAKLICEDSRDVELESWARRGKEKEENGMYLKAHWPMIMLGRYAERELSNRGAPMDSDVRRAMEHDLENN